MSRRFFKSSLLAVFAVLALTGYAFAWGVASGDGSNYGALQEKAVFFNNSGSTLTSGNVVVLDRTGTGVTAGTTLGAYITTTSTADDDEVMGVVAGGQSCANQTPCTIVTRGPAQAVCNDVTDAVTTGSEVGSTDVAGRCGGGSDLGMALEAGSGGDFENIWIWVDVDKD